ncbi:FMN-binding protein [Streptomyces sp. G-G2]|uniref:FMN-binding protein n=1 Tax=Streptomyces sp. G-G2 TaxID=3046201 RepID=UPI0024B9A378|nr:FMN-binding protein [Streptomyces sp. G-G2]MDJ0385569.1 FMN-binding protein [Streptomyces sp. G-G2]
MRRTAVTTAATIAGIAALLALKPHQPERSAASAQAPTGRADPVTPAPGASGAGRTGTFTGSVTDTRYGQVQVEVTLSGGRLTAVRILQAPSENRRDKEINSYALPRLTDEALGAQSADIDTVSGASYTSEGYISSLQSALDGSRA